MTLIRIEQYNQA